MVDSFRSLLALILCLALAPGLGSCASIMTGTESCIAVTSMPAGAKVTTSTGLETETPCTLSLPNGAEVMITAEHGGHPGDVRTVKSVPDLSRWCAINLFMIGGTAGMVSDMANPTAHVHKLDVHFDFSVSAEELARRAQAKKDHARQRRADSGGTLRWQPLGFLN